MKYIDLVDSIEYTTTNSFTHQLHTSLHSIKDVEIETISLDKISHYPKPEAIICRLKQRTLHRVMNQIRDWAGDAPIVIFDQDPWHAYMKDSPYKGVYESAKENLNLQFVALTTEWWANFLREKNIPSKFVKMGVLPEYCDKNIKIENKSVELGFIGQLHPYRKNLFDFLHSSGIYVNHLKTESNYKSFLNSLSKMKIFIHAEDCEIELEDRKTNLKNGLWIKDIEALSRGCFSIRNAGLGMESYGLDKKKTFFSYSTMEEIPEIISSIRSINIEKQNIMLNEVCEEIRAEDNWKKTAEILVNF